MRARFFEGEGGLPHPPMRPREARLDRWMRFGGRMGRKNQWQDMGRTNEENNHKAIAFLTELAVLTPIDCTDIDEVRRRFSEFIDLCDKHKVRPLTACCAMAYGMNRDVFSRFMNGDASVWRSRGIPDEVREFFSVAVYSFLEGVMEVNLAEESGNPVKWIVFAKNHFGYRDQSERVITYRDEKPKLPDADEVARKYAGLVGRDEAREIGAVVEPVYELPVKPTDGE